MKFIVSSKIALVTAVLLGSALTNVNADSVKDLSIVGMKIPPPVGEGLCTKITVYIRNNGAKISDMTYKRISLNVVNNKTKKHLISTSISFLMDPDKKLKEKKGKISYEYSLHPRNFIPYGTYADISAILSGPDEPGKPNVEVIKSAKLYCGGKADTQPPSKPRR